MSEEGIEEEQIKLTIIREVRLMQVKNDEGKVGLLVYPDKFSSNYEMIGWLHELWPTAEVIIGRWKEQQRREQQQ